MVVAVEGNLKAVLDIVPLFPVFPVRPQIGEVDSIPREDIAKSREGAWGIVRDGSHIFVRIALLLKLVSLKYLVLQKGKTLLEKVNIINNKPILFDGIMI